ncbi:MULTISPECIES: pteridine reductase [unclassified Legionella]|uniref:pteridine reductase n=1 Tax=unclassified Legionella TaxID=2622702 RepID=UPI0010549B54|nr:MULTISPECIES: pteridine reductase [unclassified Legionella]MDI9819641.1 pteridine reductase [Legionella sp. PL877]
MNHVNKQATKVALITGAARRIGAAMVRKLHQANFKTVIHCHQSLNDADNLARELNQQREDSACVVQGNLMAPHAAEKIIAATVDWGKRLDLLINNASVFTATALDSAVDKTDWDSLFNVNVKLPFQLSLAAYPYLKKHQGSIINITDIHADKPLKGYAVYCQTKAALAMQTKALAREFAPHVRVNAIAPGAIAWPENENSLSAEIQEKIIAQTPLRCHGQPNFIAQTLLTFIENPFITGQILAVDGGRSIG